MRLWRGSRKYVSDLAYRQYQSLDDMPNDSWVDDAFAIMGLICAIAAMMLLPAIIPALLGW